VTLLARRARIAISASNRPSMIARYGPSAGAGRPSGRFRDGGTDDASACFTVLRCTPCRAANARNDKPSRS